MIDSYFGSSATSFYCPLFTTCYLIRYKKFCEKKEKKTVDFKVTAHSLAS